MSGRSTTWAMSRSDFQPLQIWRVRSGRCDARPPVPLVGIEAGLEAAGEQVLVALERAPGQGGVDQALHDHEAVAREGSGLVVGQLESTACRWRRPSSSDIVDVALPLLGRDEAMAGGGFGPTSGGVVLHEGRSEELAGRRAVLEAVRRLEKIAREGGPPAASRPSAGAMTGRRRVEAFLDAPERGTEEHGEAVVRAGVGTRDPQLQPCRLRVMENRPKRTAVVAHAPGRRRGRPVSRSEAAVGVGVGGDHGHELGEQRDDPGDRLRPRLGEHARPRRRGAACRRRRSAARGWGGRRARGTRSRAAP